MKATMPSEVQDDDLMDDDSDEVPSGLDESSGSDEDEDGQDGEQNENDEDEDGEELGFAEDSDAEDLLPLDAEVPMGLMDFDGLGSDGGEGEDEEEWAGISSGPKEKQKGKRKRDEEDGKKSRRKKLRALPTFASYEDYAKLIEDGPEDNI